MSSTASSRPGGKFGGKFSGRGKGNIGRGKTSLPSNNNCNWDNSSNNRNKNDDSTSTTMNEVTMEKIKLQRSKLKRHEVFDKLDQAESMVLDILNIASETTKGFEYLASDSNHHHLDGISKDNDEDDNSPPMKEKVEIKWKNKIRQNGKLYMDNLKQIHDLLITHSNLVVDYGIINNIAKQDKVEEGAETKNNIDGDSNNNDDASSTKTQEGKVENDNMYASRLEMRLAIDKKNLLNDLVELEKNMIKEENINRDDDDDDELKPSGITKHEEEDVEMKSLDGNNAGIKRKREE